VILALFTAEGRIADLAASVSVQLTTTDGSPQGPPVTATAVRPEGVAEVSYVAFLDIPTSGWWNAVVSATTGGTTHAGVHSVSVLDPGGTAALGAPAPTARTPTLADVGGRPLAVTTDPIPDLRMYGTSTADALAAGKPFVLVVDSVRFRVTAVCGKAVVLAKYLLDRWAGMTFIHLEPYKYNVVTDTAVLEGSLGAPTIVPAAQAWGVAAEPWGAGSMPWIFIVDGRGIVTAKYQGIIGSADVDVLLTYLAARG
jgi:formylmethanofuran dehydrogenase subunit D